jgi:hypothetical protein
MCGGEQGDRRWDRRWIREEEEVTHREGIGGVRIRKMG